MANSSSQSRKTTITNLTRSIDDFPTEVIQEILSRLPITSLSQSRYVSQTWRGLVNDPRLSIMHYVQSCYRIHLTTTTLILSGENSGMYYIPDFTTCPKAIKLNNLPFKSWLPTYKVIGSCNGFICVADITGLYRSIFICNPVIGESYLVPENESIFGNVIGQYFGFGYTLKTNEYKVVKMRYNRNEKYYEVEIHTLGTSTWRRVGKVKGIIDGSSNIRCCNIKRNLGTFGVLLDGSLHWLGILDGSENVSIIIVHLEDEKVRDILPISIENIVGKISQFYRLGELGGRLIIVDDGCDKNVNVWVMEEYGIWGNWTKKYIIERTVVFGLYANFLISFRPLLMKQDGEILVEINESELFLYHPQRRSFKAILVNGISDMFRAVPHVGTLVSLNQAVEIADIEG